MSSSVEQILRDALELDLKERADIAYRLLVSLDGEPDEGVEQAWSEEIARRVKEVEEGQVELIPWEQIEWELRAFLAKKRGE